MADYTIYRGDRKVWTRTFKTNSGAAQDLTGCSVWTTVKKSVLDADADAVVKHYWTQSAESGLSRTDPDTGAVSPLAAGILYDTLSPTESAALSLRVYVYDVQIKDSNDVPTTVEKGRLVITGDATIRTTTP